MKKDKYVEGDIFPNVDAINAMPQSFSKHVYEGHAMPLVRLTCANKSMLVGIEFKKTGRKKTLSRPITLNRKETK